MIETSQDDTTLAEFTTFSGIGTTLTLNGAAAATDSPGVIIPIAINFTGLTIVASSPVNNADIYQSFGTAAIPEPSTGLLLAGAVLFVLGRKNARLNSAFRDFARPGEQVIF